MMLHPPKSKKPLFREPGYSREKEPIKTSIVAGMCRSLQTRPAPDVVCKRMWIRPYNLFSKMVYEFSRCRRFKGQLSWLDIRHHETDIRPTSTTGRRFRAFNPVSRSKKKLHYP